MMQQQIHFPADAVVVNEEVPVVYQAKEVEREEENEMIRTEEEKKRRNKRRMYMFIFVVVVISAGVGAGVGAYFGTATSETYITNITSAPTPSPTLLGDYEYLEFLFRTISGDEVLDETTPQFQALESIYNESQSGVYNVRDLSEQHLEERYALRVLYYSTQGDGWGLADNNFTSTLPTCSWLYATQGNRLQCNEQDEVTDLFLNVVNLNGTIPSELGALSMLSQLSLAKNELYGKSVCTGTCAGSESIESKPSRTSLLGTIPNSLGDLDDMKFLQLALNKLSGSIPTTFERFTKLERLIIHINHLTGTLPNIWSNSFERLRLNDNKLNGTIPEMPTQMPLDWFQISDNNFSVS
jgi:hypothetical protein